MQYQIATKTYELLTLTGVLCRARMIFMDNEKKPPKTGQYQTPKHELYLRNSFHWEDSGVFFPLGLFLVSRENKIVAINLIFDDLFDRLGPLTL